jgi:hypothetical protein
MACTAIAPVEVEGALLIEGRYAGRERRRPGGKWQGATSGGATSRGNGEGWAELNCAESAALPTVSLPALS